MWPRLQLPVEQEQQRCFHPSGLVIEFFIVHRKGSIIPLEYLVDEGGLLSLPARLLQSPSSLLEPLLGELPGDDLSLLGVPLRENALPVLLAHQRRHLQQGLQFRAVNAIVEELEVPGELLLDKLAELLDVTARPQVVDPS